MAQFMISVFHDPGVQSSGEAYQSEDDMQCAFEAVAAFNQDLQDNGQLVLAGGLTPPEVAHTPSMPRVQRAIPPRCPPARG